MKRDVTRGGILAALVTPYRPDDSLEESMVARLVEKLLGQGMEGFYVGGSTGEAFLQSHDERARMLSLVARATAGRAQIIAHVGAIATDETIALARCAADEGFDAISAIPPFYYGFSSAELTAHYQALAAAVPIPLVIYNFGGKAGNLTGDDLLRLLDDPRVLGVKHTSQDLYLLERFKRRRPDAVIYNGYDEMCLAGLSMGADGAIGTTYNFMGDLFLDLRTAFEEGRMRHALDLQRRANQVIDVLVEVGVFPGTKEILRRQGYDCGHCRAPFGRLDEGSLRKLHACVDRLLARKEAA